ncbi:MAG: hypothetical protein AB7O24_10955 [Kofleriaceae bacterium]
MRAQVVLVGLGVFASSAVAEPQPNPGRAPIGDAEATIEATVDPTPSRACNVTVLIAPADVRPVIDAWVRAEPRCAAALSVRVFEVDEGLYVLARTPTGRVHERLVPDADAAGVLVASWAADDAIAALPSPPASPHRWPPARRSTAPGMVEPMPIGREVGPGATVKTRRISAGWMAVVNGEGFGGRLDVDLIGRGRWRFGVAGSIGQQAIQLCASLDCATAELTEVRFFAHVARVLGREPAQLRMSLGAGLAQTAAHTIGAYGEMTATGTGVSPAMEAQVLLSVALGRSWTVAAGPIVTQVVQRVRMADVGMAWSPSGASVMRDPSLTLFVGMAYRL